MMTLGPNIYMYRYYKIFTKPLGQWKTTRDTCTSNMCKDNSQFISACGLFFMSRHPFQCFKASLVAPLDLIVAIFRKQTDTYFHINIPETKDNAMICTTATGTKEKLVELAQITVGMHCQRKGNKNISFKFW